MAEQHPQIPGVPVEVVPIILGEISPFFVVGKGATQGGFGALTDKDGSKIIFSAMPMKPGEDLLTTVSYHALGLLGGTSVLAVLNDPIVVVKPATETESEKLQVGYPILAGPAGAKMVNAGDRWLTWRELGDLLGAAAKLGQSNAREGSPGGIVTPTTEVFTMGALRRVRENMTDQRTDDRIGIMGQTARVLQWLLSKPSTGSGMREVYNYLFRSGSGDEGEAEYHHANHRRSVVGLKPDDVLTDNSVLGASYTVGDEAVSTGRGWTPELTYTLPSGVTVIEPLSGRRAKPPRDKDG